MKNKKIWITCIVVVLLVIILLVILTLNDKHLSKKYYGKHEFITVETEDIEKMRNETYLLYIHYDYCIFTVPTDNVIQEMMDKYNISVLKMHYEKFSKTYLHDEVKYAPSLLIVKNGKILDFLDAESDEDLPIYQDSNKMAEWVSKYVDLTK